MELPKTRQEVKDYNPKLIVLFGKPKSGKSTLAAALDNNLILDLEDGYRSLPVMRMQPRSFKDIYDIHDAIIDEARKNKKWPYKFITIDNASRLEEMALAPAAALYRSQPKGAGWKMLKDKKTGEMYPDPDADVRTLPQGAGYQLIRDVVTELLRKMRKVCSTLILVAHVKDKQINIDGEEITEMSIDLAGKLANIVAGEADAVGLVYRQDNKTFISFKGGDGTVKEARPLHLRGKVFEVASSDENNEVTVDLSKIFI